MARCYSWPMRDPIRRFLPYAALLLLIAGCTHTQRGGMTTWKEITDQTPEPADHRLKYGDDPLNFGDLRVPAGTGPFPVVVVIHGGCWQSEYDLGHVGGMSDALARNGWAVWTIEYRRIGDPGGGWPG